MLKAGKSFEKQRLTLQNMFDTAEGIRFLANLERKMASFPSIKRWFVVHTHFYLRGRCNQGNLDYAVQI